MKSKDTLNFADLITKVGIYFVIFLMVIIALWNLVMPFPAWDVALEQLNLISLTSTQYNAPGYTPQKFNRIRLGDTQKEVFALLGEPIVIFDADSMGWSSRKGEEQWNYYFDPHDYDAVIVAIVIFDEDGKVKETLHKVEILD